jgi:uncharacterized protein with PhoU and TrkA domain
MSYIIHNDRDINERIHDLEKTVLDLIIKVDKLSIKSEPEPEKEKPVNLVELYNLKPLSFYSEQ